MDISPEQQSDWANTLLENLEDTTTSKSWATNWLRSNLGILNSRIHTNFTVNESGYITPALNDIQTGLYNELFICSWLRKKSITVLGTMEYDWTSMEGADQGKVTRVSHMARAATYQKLAQECNKNYIELVKTYNGGEFATPRQITFNHRHSTPLNIFNDRFSWSDRNPINYIDGY